jgi:hypothetical protein
LSATIPNITPSQNTPGLAEHTPHGEAAERSELLAQKFAKAVAGNHFYPASSVLIRPVVGCDASRGTNQTDDSRYIEPLVEICFVAALLAMTPI